MENIKNKKFTTDEIEKNHKARKRVRDFEDNIIFSCANGMTKKQKVMFCSEYKKSKFLYVGYLRGRHEWRETERENKEVGVNDLWL